MNDRQITTARIFAVAAAAGVASGLWEYLVLGLAGRGAASGTDTVLALGLVFIAVFAAGEHERLRPDAWAAIAAGPLNKHARYNGWRSLGNAAVTAFFVFVAVDPSNLGSGLIWWPLPMLFGYTAGVYAHRWLDERSWDRERSAVQ